VQAIEAEPRLRDLGLRGDIIKTMHRALTERGLDRAFDDFVINAPDKSPSIVGRLVETGLHDVLSGEAYAVIDGVDGRAHHIRFKDVDAFDHAPPYGGIVELRRFGEGGDPNPTLVRTSRG
jgi:type IV secretory pathway VirD2 relaxase